MIPTIPPTADELLAEIDRAHTVNEDALFWAEVTPEDPPAWFQILAAWVVVLLGLLACLAVWFVAITAVSWVLRQVVAS